MSDFETYQDYQLEEQRELWANVFDALEESKGIAWDGCHKIYILMDDEQMDLMRECGYDKGSSMMVDTANYDNPLELVQSWFDESCGLRLVNSVKTVSGNANDGFVQIIPQFHDAFNEDEEDEE